MQAGTSFLYSFLCLLLVNSASDNRKNAQRLLTEEKKTIGVSPGGVAEIFETNTDNETIILRFVLVCMCIVIHPFIFF